MAKIPQNNLKGYSTTIPVVKNKQELLQQLAFQLHFPDYFGFNWDALLELFQDFCWISEKNIIITHKDISCLSQKDYAIYKEIVNETINFWKSRIEHNVYFIFEGNYD
jgi:RNAse (barnase) inhibitor barstar